MYHWRLRDRLPEIPVPLADDDPDVPLNLVITLTNVFDRSGYAYLVDYCQAIEPPLNAADEQWIQHVLGRLA